MFKKQISLLLLCLLLLCAVGAQAQTTEAEAKNRFNQGKQLFEEGKYDLAMEAFRPLMAPGNANAFSEYAQYYYGLSQFRKKNYANAQQALVELLQKAPNWHDKEEIHYLLGVIAFERRQYPQAIENLNKVSSDELKKDARDAKLHYLGRISAKDTLQRLHEQFPRDEAVAYAFVERLYYSPDKMANQALIDKLVKNFNMERFSAKQKQQQQNRDYNVAVLFPFGLKNLNTTSAGRSNQFVLDMYEGMELARQDLEKGGIKIKLHAYDTERDAEKVAKLVKLPEMTGMDLVVGPVYTNGAAAVTEFARNYQINVVNPLSTNLSITENNYNVFLAETSPESQAKQIAAYALKNFANKRVAILYDKNPRDSLRAAHYRKAVQAQGGEVKIFREVTKSAAGSMGAILKRGNLDSLGHVYVSSSEPLVATGLIAALELNRSRVPVIAPSDWLESAGTITLDQWQRQNVHFIFPGFIYDNEEVKSFRNRYAEKTNMIPSVYAFQGYEMMMYFGKVLANYGPEFQDAIRRMGFRKGVTMGGFDYTNASDNQFVPLVIINEGLPKVVNEPLQ